MLSFNTFIKACIQTLKGLGACGFLIFFISCSSSPQKSEFSLTNNKDAVKNDEQSKKESAKAQNQYRFTRAYYDRF